MFRLQVHEALPLHVAIDAVSGAATSAGVDPATAASLLTAIDSLLNEARARESFSADDEAITLQLQLSGNRLVTTISDSRMPASASGSVAALKLLDKSNRIGMSVTSGAALGNHIECSAPIAIDHGARPPEPQTAPATARVDDATASATVLRPATSADAAGIVRLTYRGYGYTYPNDVMYSPDALARLIGSGTMWSQIAVGADGEVVGHTALTFDGDIRLPESGRTLVDARFRGRGIAERLLSDILARSVAAGIPGVFGECVANHTASQRMVLALGGTEVGLMVGALPGTLRFADFDNHLTGRASIIPAIMPGIPGEFETMYLPEHLIPTYTEIIDRLGERRTVVDADRPAQGQVSLVSSVNQGFGSGRVQIVKSGVDGVERVQDELTAMSASDLGAVYLDVPLADPTAPRIVRIAEEHGFFWAALLPSARTDGDVLRLQRLGSQPVDIEDVQCASEHGERMMQWVLAERERVSRS